MNWRIESKSIPLVSAMGEVIVVVGLLSYKELFLLLGNNNTNWKNKKETHISIMDDEEFRPPFGNNFSLKKLIF